MKKDKDSLGNRMKKYERQYAGMRFTDMLPTCARMDGRAFHTFTNGLIRPYDVGMQSLMIETTKWMVEETGAKIGYCQSDEISLVWYEDDTDKQIFFDGKVLKMTSILASMATAYFNRRLPEFLPSKVDKLPMFDARAWTVPKKWEAVNYLQWRELDATRNSITMAAQSVYSHTELHGVSSAQKQEMLFAKGINWNDYPASFKRGTYCQRRQTLRPYTTEELDRLPPKHNARANPSLVITRSDVVVLDMPPLNRVINKQAVIFDGEDPQVASIAEVA